MNLIYKYVNKELEGKDVNNTNPNELQELYNEQSDRTIEGREKRLKFSIVNFLFFSFIWFILYTSPMDFSQSIIIIPSIIALVFSLSALIFGFSIKDEIRRKKMIYSIIEGCK